MKVSFKTELLVKMGIDDIQSSQPKYVDLVNLVRSIQRAEGNLDCYRRGRQQCDRMDCAWRDHCLKALEEPYKVGGESQEHQITANSEQDQDRLP